MKPLSHRNSELTQLSLSHLRVHNIWPLPERLYHKLARTHTHTHTHTHTRYSIYIFPSYITGEGPKSLLANWHTHTSLPQPQIFLAPKRANPKNIIPPFILSTHAVFVCLLPTCTHTHWQTALTQNILSKIVHASYLSDRPMHSKRFCAITN